MMSVGVSRWRPWVGASLAALVAMTSCTTVTCGCSDPSPVSIAVVSGDAQEAGPGEALPDSVVVRVVRNATGAPEAGILVRFYPQDGFTSPTELLTDSAGLAAAQWTVGTALGTDTLYVQPELGAPAVRFIATVK